jgi:RimJ/RimL family protein N-acetyltransferase
MQATLETAPDGNRRAHVAWVIGVAWQGRGFASEAATAVVDWLRGCGIADVRANIHPDHHASAAVARAAGMHATAERRDGETVWRWQADAQPPRPGPPR